MSPVERPDPSDPQGVSGPVVRHRPDSAPLALEAVRTLMAPVVRWLLRHGVHYGAFTEVLKSVFLDEARRELARSGQSAPSHSAISLLSGLHRKDVRALLDEKAVREARPGIPVASQVYTRWLADPSLRDGSGVLRPLPRSGPMPSFDALARSVSSDVHPRTVLDELVRLALVRVVDEQVVALKPDFVPSEDLAALTGLFVANAGDHVATAVHNLTVAGPPRLEQSVFADGLSAASASALSDCARAAWREAFDRFVAEARPRLDADNAADLPPEARHRVRFGAYFHTEPEQDAAPLPPASERAARGVRPVPPAPESE